MKNKLSERIALSKYCACMVFLASLLVAGAALSPQESAVQSGFQGGIMSAGMHAFAQGDESDDGAGEGVMVEGTFFENTAIMEFTNNSDAGIEIFEFWLSGNRSFESFKTESGWIGKKTPQSIVFTTTGQLGSGESVKFGVKTGESRPVINWSALDDNGDEVGSGSTAPEPIVRPEPDPIVEPRDGGILADSTFRIIPEKPKVGSTIRIVGEGFGMSQQFRFYIDIKEIGTFFSDKDGNFVATMKIPDEQRPDRVDFRVIDEDGEEKKISLRLAAADVKQPVDDPKLTLSRIPSTLHRGDLLEISGTGKPGSAVTASIRDAKGSMINARTAEVDSKGNWKLSESILISIDAEFGKYNVEISNGRESALGTWEVTSSKIIDIEPTKLRFEPGEAMTYGGTALPNKYVEFVLEDPLGNEIASERVNASSSGAIKFEYATQFNSKEGTYTLIATQDGSTEFIFAGLGQTPIVPIDLEFDKLNYKSNETATISLTGEASDIVKMSIIDSADKEKSNISITLGPDGVGRHSLDLSGYKSGAYTAVISKGSSESSEIFTVGLRISIGEITISTANLDYHPDDSILILGETDSNSLLTIALIDPDGNEVRVKETFSDKEGKIKDNTFKVPSDAESGHWTVNAKSGAQFDNVVINVTATQQGMIVSVREGIEIPGWSETIEIEVIGAAPSQIVMVDIISEAGDIVENLEFRTTKEGEGKPIWLVPEDIEPGTYTFKVSDAFQSVEATYQIR